MATKKHEAYLADKKREIVMTRERVIGDVMRAYVPEVIAMGASEVKLYRLEKQRNDLIQSCAEEWSRRLGLDKSMHWTHAIPQALLDTLDSFGEAYSVAAAIGYLESKGHHVHLRGATVDE